MTRRQPATRCFVSDEDPPSKQGVLRAALELFVEHGLDGTSVRMIAERAGYTNPAMFKFFDSKDALALHLFERCYDRIFGAFETAAARRPFEEALQGVLDAFVSLVEDDLEAVLFVQDNLRALWPRLSAAARKRSMLRLFRDLFERGVREGAVTGYRAPDVPVAALVGLMAQLGRMAYFGELAGPARLHRGELELAVTRLLKG
ncbi:TetR/AcrR family transcriptional regulator [Anaeromyxobacter oryzae]|uniref:TetR family transcriptional regulator n=1 Tax=Anaeromyxobacter oryzae TaxID=2918170 RepID=A0ABN6MXL5_9BACT|nr:TetR/AcrR family transcriptional regulator [Anaeromyxobacter oryzae]BDG05311.1 TetR family transcriptional regulator [Anaeromyxobacter oryzae]